MSLDTSCIFRFVTVSACDAPDGQALRGQLVVVPYSIRTRAPGVQCFEPRKLVAMNQTHPAAQRSAAYTDTFGAESDGGS